jgi:type VI secretion system protein ImpG
MDPRLLKYYNAELQHLREMSGEFAGEFPKIAGRLGLDAFECADPYVERLIEGFAFLAARVRLKTDAEFPRFTQHLLDLVYPHFLTPAPSMAVVRFQPDLREGGLAEGFRIPRGTELRSLLGKSDHTPCDYRTGHDLTLWPLELVEAEYLGSPGAVGALGVGELQGVKAAIRLRLRATAGLSFDKLTLDALPIFLRGGTETPMRLYELLFAATQAVVVRPAVRPVPWQRVIRDTPIRPVGFQAHEALLPYTAQSFDGYRLLREYFLFPNRFMFFELAGLGQALRRCTGNQIDVIILLKRGDPALDNAVSAEEFALFCAPAVNLFPKRADRIHLNEQSAEHHLVVDRTRPMDFEIYKIDSVVGYGAGNDRQQAFWPFFTSTDLSAPGEGQAYYAVRREPRRLSTRQRSRGSRSSYVGSEVFLSLVDAAEAPYRHDLRQIAVEALCTNRDLPIDMPVGKGTTDFTLQLGAPVESVRCMVGPTRPKPSHGDGDTTWQLISHLSLNYLSLIDSNAEEGAAALRQLLSLYADAGDPAVAKQIEALRSVISKPIVRRTPIAGPIAFARGIEVSITYAEEGFEGTGGFLLGAVLERFFAQYSSINSFSETVLRAQNRGEIMRWQRRIGQRHTL